MAMRRRKRRIRGILLTAGIIAAAAAILLGLFRIRKVEIVGNSLYTAEAIQEDLIYDFWTENTLYFAWKYRNAVSEPRAPYLDTVQVKIISPGSVQLLVREKVLSGYVQYAGSNVYFDSTGTVLEITETVYDGIPLVSGVTMEEPSLYQKLPVGNAAQMRTMLSITQLLIDAELIPDNISFDENLNISLSIGSVQVELGQDEYLEEKVANLVTIYQEISGQSGTLHMEGFTGRNETITFEQSGEESQPQTAETDESGNPVETAETDENGNPVETAETDENGNPVETGETDENGNPTETAETDENGNPAETGETDENGNPTDASEEEEEQEVTGMAGFMVFDSTFTLRYDARVVNGQVVDANGIPIDGCTVNEDGNVVDAYMNVIDPYTGQPVQ